MKYFLRTLAIIGSVILLGAIPPIAKAQQTCTQYTPLVTGPSVIDIDPTVPVGTSLWSGTLSVAGTTTATCIGGQAVLTYTGVGPRENTYLTYATGVAGIGMRMKYSAGVVAGCSEVWFPCTTASLNWVSGKVGDHSIFVEFIKTGPITTSGSMSGLFMSYSAKQAVGYNGVWGQYIWANPVNFNVAVPTCMVTTPNITVPMGSVPVSDFSAGVGAVSSSKAFNIALSCSGGVANSYTNVYITLTDAINPANVTNTLPLNPSSTASGVGIQVLNGGTPVMFGPDSSVAGNPNQWFAGAATNGAFNIPLSARYIRTGTVTPGSANGSATFTMSYQ